MNHWCIGVNDEYGCQWLKLVSVMKVGVNNETFVLWKIGVDDDKVCVSDKKLTSMIRNLFDGKLCQWSKVGVSDKNMESCCQW